MFSGLNMAAKGILDRVPSKAIQAEKAFSIDSCFSIDYYILTDSLLRLN